MGIKFFSFGLFLKIGLVRSVLSLGLGSLKEVWYRGNINCQRKQSGIHEDD